MKKHSSIPYLLLTAVTLQVDRHGQRWIERLWLRDLEAHFKHFNNLRVAVSTQQAESIDEAFYVRLEDVETSIVFIEVKNFESLAQLCFSFFPICRLLWKEVGRSKLVHTGVAGHPLPLGLFGGVFAKLRKKFLVVLVESSPWRLNSGGSNTSEIGFRIVSFFTNAKKSLKAWLFENCASYLLKRSDIAFYTTEEYREDFPARSQHVVPACWICEEDIISASALSSRLASLAERDTLKAIFVGRLTEAKGAQVLLDAIDLLRVALEEEKGKRLELHIFGMGPLEQEYRKVAAQKHSYLTCSFEGTLAYGEEFFSKLAEYDLLLLPSLGSEQPRILFDALSQGVPVFSSRASGVLPFLEHDVSGRLYEQGSAQAIAEEILWALENRKKLADLSLKATEEAKKYSIELMHSARYKKTSEALNKAGVIE